MKKVQIWFKQHPKYKEFYKLEYRTVDAKLREILEDNICPFYDDGEDVASFIDAVESNFSDTVEGSKETFFYALHTPKRYSYSRDNDETTISAILSKISDNVLFVDKEKNKYDVEVLFNIAKKYFNKKFSNKKASWWPTFAKNLTNDFIGYTFSERRNFLKGCGCKIPLRGFKDLDNPEIYYCLKAEDFYESTSLVIKYGLGDYDENGNKLELNICNVNDIKKCLNNDLFVVFPGNINFLHIAEKGWSSYNSSKLAYNCKYKRDTGNVLLLPDTNEEATNKEEGSHRKKIEKYADKYGNGRFTFKLSIEDTEKFSKDTNMPIIFSLKYGEAKNEEGNNTMRGNFKKNIAFWYLGDIFSEESNNDKFVNFFRIVDEKVTGVKEELVDRYIKYAAKFYDTHLDILKKKLNKKFIIVNDTGSREDTMLMTTLKINDFYKEEFWKENLSEYFMVKYKEKGEKIENKWGNVNERKFEKELDIWERFCNLIVAAYVLKHLRGNRVFDPSYENKFYTVEEGIRALVEDKVKISQKVLMKVV